MTKRDLKLKLLEEPFVLASLVSGGGKKKDTNESRNHRRQNCLHGGQWNHTPTFTTKAFLPLLKLDLCLSSGLAFESRVSEDILVDNSFVQGDIRRVPCRNEVTIIINFHKRLELWPLGDFLLAHGSSHFAGIAINSSHQSMTVGSVWGAIINILHDDRFASGVATGQDQHHLPRFHELAHLGSYHSGLQQKARKGTSANLSPQEAWSHFPVVFKH